MTHDESALLFEQRLEALAREIEAWNRQINLVTRVDTGRKLPQMIRHCVIGWELARKALGAHPWFSGCLYVDVGSGAGLPGLVWAAARAREGHAGRTLLVEPRAKRAWFLQRTARDMGLVAVEVSRTRWGESRMEHGEVGSLPAMISLKALRLEDATVLDGLSGAARAPSPAVAIIRFMPPDGDRPGISDRADEPRGPAAAPERSEPRLRGATPVPGGYRLEERRILGSGVPRLSLVRYGGSAGGPCSTWNIPD